MQTTGISRAITMYYSIYMFAVVMRWYQQRLLLQQSNATHPSVRVNATEIYVLIDYGIIYISIYVYR